mgnify:FL=1
MSFLALLLFRESAEAWFATTCVRSPVQGVCAHIPERAERRADGEEGSAKPHGKRKAGTQANADLLCPLIALPDGLAFHVSSISTQLQIITVHRQLAITESAGWGQIARIRRMGFPLIFPL